MIDFEEWAKYFLYPFCKKAARIIALLGIICLWISLIGYIIALPVSHLIYQMQGASATTNTLYILGNYIAVLANLFLCAFLGLLLTWCHCVLLYQRGWNVTRTLSNLGMPAGLFIIISTLWSMLFGTTLLPNQILAPFMLMFLIWFVVMCNWGNMTVLSVWRRIALLCISPLLMLSILLGLSGLYFFAGLIYLPVFLMLRPLLQWLHQHAMLIVKLPPLPDADKAS